MEGVDIDTRNPRSAGGDQKNLLYFPRNAGLLLTNMPILYIMENEKDDIQKTKLNDNGTLCTGQKDSLKDSVLSKEYPRQMSIIYNREQENKTMKTSKKPQTAIDKPTDLVYNTTMLNKTTTTKENEMKDTITRLQTYQGNLVHVTSVNKFWNEATVYFVSPEGKQPMGCFKVGLPRLKKLGQKV